MCECGPAVRVHGWRANWVHGLAGSNPACSAPTGKEDAARVNAARAAKTWPQSQLRFYCARKSEILRAECRERLPQVGGPALSDIRLEPNQVGSDVQWLATQSAERCRAPHG